MGTRSGRFDSYRPDCGFRIMVITSACGAEDMGPIPIGHISIKIKALGPNRAMLGRRGTVRFGYLGE